MLKNSIAAFLLLITCTCSAYEIEKRHTVLFDKDRFEIKGAELSSLKRFIKVCNLNLDYKFIIEGHTDSDGSVDYNRILSKQRAQTVARFLIRQEVKERYVETEMHSELLPIASNLHEEGMSQNRRVTLIYRANYFESLNELSEHLSASCSETHAIDNSDEHLLITNRGVRLHMPAAAFVDDEGSPVSEVDVIVMEAADPFDFMSLGLETKTTNGLLESGGMLSVDVYDKEGNALALREGAALTIAIPDDERQAGMEIFSSPDEGSTWVQEAKLIETPAPEPPVQREEIELPDFKAPRFVADKTLKPYFPAEPTQPNYPTRPERENFIGRTKLQDLFSMKKKHEREERMYQTAVAHHAKRVQRYERRLDSYANRCNRYHEKLDDYRVKEEIWQKELKRQLRVHEDSVVPAAFDSYMAWVEEVKAENEDANVKYSIDMNSWKKQQANALDVLGIPPGEEVGQYIFRATRLGWANVDRFMKLDEDERHDIVAQSPGSEESEKIFVMLRNGRSMISFAQFGDKEFVLQGFPKRELAELFAYTVIDGQVHIYTEKFVGKDKFEVEYEPSSIAELRTLLKRKSMSLGSL